MSVSCPPSSKVRGYPPGETRFAEETYEDVHEHKLIQSVNGQAFIQTYLPGASINPTAWSSEQQLLLNKIKATLRGDEKSLYTAKPPPEGASNDAPLTAKPPPEGAPNDAPLLRLLNHISKQVSESAHNMVQQVANDAEREVLVFNTGDNRKVYNPFYQQERTPDIIALWEKANHFPEVDYYQDRLPRTNWCALAVTGEVKVKSKRRCEDGRYQLGAYLQNHLQLHPELNAVLGLTARPNGYALFYHDANVIHRSGFPWDQPGPLYAFIEKLYNRPFRDTSMQVLDDQSQPPVWAMKIGQNVYISEGPRALVGPGQRRFTTTAIHVETLTRVFIKDIWRDVRRSFFESLLFEQAHKGEPLPGLMLVEPQAHGYVLDKHEQSIRTIDQIQSTGNHPRTRYKMRMVTTEIGRALDEVRSLRQFLCVMYDACVVQRNLYRKCRVLHRDISYGNIMLAPNTDEYRKRCASGFAEVKFVNQVLTKEKKCDPEPTCLVIDLGNGADLKDECDRDRLTERTGTPRFIARSVSSGMVLDKHDFSDAGVKLPSANESAGAYYQFMHTEYQHEIASIPDSVAESNMEFTHQLFHDAESTFWVIAWTLAQSARPGYQREPNPHANFRNFFYTMYQHYPTPGEDTRLVLWRSSEDYWKSILHPDLEILGTMLSKMFRYIRPEWAYRQDLNPEHVHEALMRLLLEEIVRIDEDSEDIDIPLVIGVRSKPPPPPGVPDLPRSSMNSFSFNATTSYPPTSGTFEHQRNSLGRERSNSVQAPMQPDNSRVPEPQASQLASDSQQPTPELDEMAKHDKEELARDQLRERARRLEWDREACKLEPPQPQAPKIQAPEQNASSELS